jgi:hypothetical protein
MIPAGVLVNQRRTAELARPCHQRFIQQKRRSNEHEIGHVQCEVTDARKIPALKVLDDLTAETEAFLIQLLHGMPVALALSP